MTSTFPKSSRDSKPGTARNRGLVLVIMSRDLEIQITRKTMEATYGYSPRHPTCCPNLHAYTAIATSLATCACVLQPDEDVWAESSLERALLLVQYTFVAAACTPMVTLCLSFSAGYWSVVVGVQQWTSTFPQLSETEVGRPRKTHLQHWEKRGIMWCSLERRWWETTQTHCPS